ncbi:MAG: dihydroorotate dehydrogenase [Crenarchaeota archaeon]|nr:dihydroorotate dehydrogenase [Thermoproteota archaeon]
MASLRVRVAGVELENPLMNASGLYGSKPELLLRVAEAGAGALVTKTFTYMPLPGYPTPIAVPVECGLINAVGLRNTGIDGLRNLLDRLKGVGKPVVVSIAAASIREAEVLAAVAEEHGAALIEVNASCPHSPVHGGSPARHLRLLGAVVEAAASTTTIPVGVKLGVMDNLVDVAAEMLERGARFLTLINTVKAMKIDVYTRRPVLGHGVGGLSGKAIHPVAVAAVYMVYRELRPCIIGVGGVEDWRDAVELMLAGASAVQVGTATIKGLHVFREIVDGIRGYLEKEGYRSVEEIIGAALA